MVTPEVWAVHVTPSYANNIFVVSGVDNASGAGIILTSADGTTWTAQTSNSAYGLWGTTFGNNTLVMVGDLGTILTSPDGVTWTAQTSGVTKMLMDVIYSNNLFVAVGDDGTILSSADGTTWIQQTSGSQDVLRGISSA